MKYLKFLPVLVILFFSACKKENTEVVIPEEKTDYVLLSPEEINQRIDVLIDENGNFNWNDADIETLWSAVIHGDSLITVGYGNMPYSESPNKANDDVKNALIDKIVHSEGITNKENVEVAEDEILTVFDIKADKIETIIELRKDPNVRYIEASGYEYFRFASHNKSDSGCDRGTESINPADYTLYPPNCYVSWSYQQHNIPQAWSLSTGQGITIGLIDTGVSSEQSLLGSNFNDGYSSGRTIEKYGTYVDSWWPWSTKTDGPDDKCSHGTSMAANLASPRNNNFMPAGVAYNSNLVSYRGTSDVVLDGYHEQKGVAAALTALANRSDVKIISMSVGHIFTINRIKDAVQYAYSRGKLMFAAGGTSTTWTNFVGVIFPANMSETVAVTGVTDSGSIEECDVCHKGSQIVFTVVMQRAYDSDRTSPTTGFYENTKQYIGGSSIATSTTAGIAALVWARHPSWNRDQVLTKMKQSAQFYPYPDSDFGYGSVDALLAVQ